MTPKLSKEEENARKALIDAGIAQVGIKKLAYLGEPASHRSWRRSQEKKRASNRSKSLLDRGRGTPSPGATHVFREREG